MLQPDISLLFKHEVYTNADYDLLEVSLDELNKDTENPRPDPEKPQKLKDLWKNYESTVTSKLPYKRVKGL